MRGDSTGVSPVIATILLIAITVVAIGVVMVFVAGLGRPTAPITANISIRDATAGSGKLTIEHAGGDPIRGAFCGTTENNMENDNWKNLEVRVNGALVVTKDNLTKFNGASFGTETKDFKVGDVLVLESLSPTLKSGDVITVIYTPANQQLASKTVP
jgi:flagellin-like protein